jgi:hypothetical protein
VPPADEGSLQRGPARQILIVTNQQRQYHQSTTETTRSTAPQKRPLQPRIVVIHPGSQRDSKHADQRIREMPNHRPAPLLTLRCEVWSGSWNELVPRTIPRARV